jgi:hypothetical protein
VTDGKRPATRAGVDMYSAASTSPFMKNNPWSNIKSEKDFQNLIVRVEQKAWHQENIYRKNRIASFKKAQNIGNHLWIL